MFIYKYPQDHLETTNVGHLLGDSGYPLKTTLLTPFLHPGSVGEVLFNEAHMKGRVCVERAFGVTKSRFRYILIFTSFIEHDYTIYIIIENNE